MPNLYFDLAQSTSAQSFGYMWQGSQLLKDGAIASYLEHNIDWHNFVSRCEQASGEWCALIPHSNELWLTVDDRSSERLYYRRVGMRIYWARNGYDLLGLGDNNWDEDVVLMFMRWGFAPLEHTLVEEIKRVPPGAIVRISPQGEQVYYYDTPQPVQELSYTDAKQGLRTQLEQSAERLTQLLGGRLAIIPLTGGYDSRMIALQLKELGYQHILGISYGRAGNLDATRGAEIARRLGIKHLFISSTQEGKLNYTQDEAFLTYMREMTGLSSGYYYQEYLPSRALSHYGADAVVLPGHQGDDLGGSQQIYPDLGSKLMNAKVFARMVVQHMGMHQAFSHNELKRLLAMHETIALGYPRELSLAEGLDLFMQRERIGKYNLNSQASWRSAGLVTAGMYLDKALSRYAYSLPWAYRYGKRLYEEVYAELFTQAGLNLPEDKRLIHMLQSPKYRIKQRLKPWLRPLLPQGDIFKGELIGFRELMRPVAEAIARDGRFRPTSINGLSFVWYLTQLEQTLARPLPLSQRLTTNIYDYEPQSLPTTRYPI